MASTAKQPIDSELPNDGSTAGNGTKSDIKITKISGSNGAKIEGNKITLNLKGEDATDKAANDNVEDEQPKPSQIKSSNNSTTPTAANDNQEEPPHTEQAPPAEKPENSTPETGHPDQSTPDKTPPPPTNNDKEEKNPKDNNPTTNAGEPTQPGTEEKPPVAAPQDNAQPNQTPPNDQTNNQNTPDQHQTNSKTNNTPPNSENNPPPQDGQPAQENQPQPENGQQPTTNSNEQTPPSNSTNDKNKPPESQAGAVPPTPVPENHEQKPPNSDADTNKQPPKTNTPTGDEITDTSPHGIDKKTPPTVSPSAQSKKASDVASGQSSDKANNRLGHKMEEMAEGVENQIQKGAKSIKEAPGKMIKNIGKNIASSLESDRSRVRKLKKQKMIYNIRLRLLKGFVEGMKINKYMLILKILAPPIYNKLTNLTFGAANARDSVKIIKLKASLLALKTIKTLLYAMIAAVDYIESLTSIAKFGAALTVIIIGFFIIAISPIIAIPLFIFKFGAGTGRSSRAIRSIIKDTINPFIKTIHAQLKTLKKKVGLRKKIIKINQLLSATKQERKQHQQQQQQQLQQQQQ